MYVLIMAALAFAAGMKIGWDTASEWRAERIRMAIKLANDIGATEIAEILKRKK